MTFESITYEVDGAIVRIGINRPRTVNAIDRTMKKELLAAFRQAATECEASVVVLFGHGKNFSSGVDMKDMAYNGWEHTPDGWGGHFDEMIAISRAMWDLDIPVLSSVKGYALGAGCDVAVMADFVLAAQSARFGAPEIMMGAFAPTLIVPWLASMKKAREILMLGVEIGADEARDMGLVNRVFPDEDMDAQVELWAAHICNIPKPALRMSKKVINKQYELMGFWDSIDFNREMSVTLNLHKTVEERAASLRFIKEKGLKVLLTDMTGKMLIK